MKRLFKKQVNKKSNSKLKILLVVCLITLVGAVAYFVRSGILSSGSSCGGGKTSKLYDKSAKVIKSNSYANMENLAKEIKGNKGYESDPNCLLPLYVNAIDQNDKTAAVDYYTKITVAYDSKNGFADVYEAAGIRDIKDVKKSYDKLIESSKKYDVNTIYF